MALFALLWVAVCTTGAVASAEEIASIPSPLGGIVLARDRHIARDRRGNRQAALATEIDLATN